MTRQAYTESDSALLEAIQEAFPIVKRPFLALGNRVGMSESEVLHKVQDWLASGLIRRLGAAVDARRLGFHTTLVGAMVKPSELDQIAQQVNQLRWVSHNYLRDHKINLWFTLTTPSESVAAQILEKFASQRGVEKVYPLPMVRLFKLSVRFNPRTRRGDSKRTSNSGTVHTLSRSEKSVLRALQDQIPVDPEPYARLAQSVGLEPDYFLATLASLVQSRVIRRLGATLHHRHLGVSGNAMVVWDVSANRIDQAGMFLASRPEVSHAYQRPTYPDWPYPLYTMVHVQTQSDLQRLLATWASAIQANDYQPLFTLREYKKKPVRLFD